MFPSYEIYIEIPYDRSEEDFKPIYTPIGVLFVHKNIQKPSDKILDDYYLFCGLENLSQKYNYQYVEKKNNRIFVHRQNKKYMVLGKYAHNGYGYKTLRQIEEKCQQKDYEIIVLLPKMPRKKWQLQKTHLFYYNFPTKN